MFRQTAIISALLVAGTLGAQAQEISISKGQWTTNTSFTGTMTMGGNTMPVPAQNDSQTQCFKTEEDTTFSPDMMGLEGCNTSNVVSGKNSMSFDVACTQDGMDMTGNMSFTIAADKNSLEGTMNLSSDSNGMTVALDGTFDGQRTGDC
ncbi:MAG: hypothetical protein CMK09_17845 [Ponticaulis sp.]|nr:hypothetical protein [Ponticaulis sp.]|tara:strand:- start:2538 stop:2984 length:447 start_codon:yes stop_codon:yes gene_type:complete